MLRVFFVGFCLLGLNTVSQAGDAKTDSDAYLGTWRQVAAVMDGKEINLGLSKTLLTLTSEGYSLTVDGKPFQAGKATSKSDQANTHFQSEVTVTEGESIGTKILQISKIEGDVLIVCNGVSFSKEFKGKVEYPKEFKSKMGSGELLSVWIRVK